MFWALPHTARALADSRSALALGGAITLPEFCAGAGVMFACDAATLGEVGELIARSFEELV